jgi:hypothetical protein
MPLRPVLATAVALFHLGCFNAPMTPPPAEVEPRVVRTYDVPAGAGRDLRNAINGLSGASREKEPEAGVTARAQLLPDGRVAVYAPESFQAGVKQLVDGLASKPPPPLLSFRVWQVRGVPGKGSVAPGLEVLRPTLDELTKVVGPMDFTLVEPTLINVASGEHAESIGEWGRVEIEGSVLGETVFARLKVEARNRRLETSLQLPKGKTVVIGQSSVRDEKDGSSSTLFSVVQASVAHVADGGQ